MGVREQNRAVKLLAGGHSLVPLLNIRLPHPEVIIDLNPLASQLQRSRSPIYRGMRGAFQYLVRGHGRALRIGALTRHYLLSTHPQIVQHCPLIGRFFILTRGTIAASLLHADPAAELPLIFATLGATATLHNAHASRVLDASAFFLTYLTTNLEPGELLTEVAIPIIPPRSAQAIAEFALRHGDFALAIAAAQVRLAADATLQTVRLGIGGVGPTPLDCSHALAPLVGKAPTPSSLREALHTITDELNPPADIHASTQYRKELAQTLAYRAIDHAIQKASQ